MISSRATQRSEAIKAAPCPRCYGEIQEVLNEEQPFFGDEALPRTVGKCSRCGYTYDPHTGLILDTGDGAQTASLRDLENEYLIRPKD